MDIELGRKYSFIDFDYREFDIEAKRLGMTDSTKTSLTIRLANEMRGDGCFYPEESTVYMNAHLNVARLNKQLSHELQHVADVGNNAIEHSRAWGLLHWVPVRESKKRLVASTWALAGLTLATQGHEALQNTLAGTSVGLTSLYLGSLAAYYAQYGERRARHAARTSQAKLLNATTL